MRFGIARQHRVECAVAQRLHDLDLSSRFRGFLPEQGYRGLQRRAQCGRNTDAPPHLDSLLRHRFIHPHHGYIEKLLANGYARAYRRAGHHDGIGAGLFGRLNLPQQTTDREALQPPRADRVLDQALVHHVEDLHSRHFCRA